MTRVTVELLDHEDEDGTWVYGTIESIEDDEA